MDKEALLKKLDIVSTMLEDIRSALGTDEPDQGEGDAADFPAEASSSSGGDRSAMKASAAALLRKTL